jgi:hypothetical protein
MPWVAAEPVVAGMQYKSPVRLGFTCMAEACGQPNTPKGKEVGYSMRLGMLSMPRQISVPTTGAGTLPFPTGGLGPDSYSAPE